MRKFVFLSIIVSLMLILFIVPSCQQKPKEEAKPMEVTEPAKEMKESAEGVVEEGKEAAGEAMEAGKEAAGETMEEGKEMMEKTTEEAGEKMK